MIELMEKKLTSREFSVINKFENPANAKLIFDRMLTLGFQVTAAEQTYVNLELDGDQIKFKAENLQEMLEMITMALLWQDAYERFREIILEQVDRDLAFAPERKDVRMFNITFAKIQIKVAIMIAKKVSRPKEVAAGIRLKKEDLMAALQIREETGCTFEAAIQLAK